MAEVIGTAAAALQLATMAVKLKRLCSEIRSMPTELVGLVDEVGVLAELLGSVRSPGNIQCQTMADFTAWEKCRQHFISSADVLQQLTSQLELISSNHKHTGSVRLYRKRDDLTRCRDRLERAKSALLMAQQAYSFAQLSQQNSLMLQEIRGIAMDQRLLANTMLRSTATIVTDTTNHSKTTCLTVQPKVDEDEDDDHQTSKTIRRTQCSSSYCLRFPAWLYSRALQILIEKSNSSWGVTFRTYNQLGSNSAVFRYALKNDWDRVKNLIRQGKASPFDINEVHLTLLHLATLWSNYDSCQFLLGCGLTLSQKDLCGRSALGFLSIGHLIRAYDKLDGQPYRHSDGHAFDCLQLLLNAASDIWTAEEDLESLLYLSHCSADVFRATKNVLCPDYIDLGREERALMAMESMSLDHQTVHELLDHDQTLQQAFSLLESKHPTTNHRSLLLRAATALGILLDSEDTQTPTCQGWKDILFEIVTFEQASLQRLPFFTVIEQFIYSHYGKGRHLWVRRNLMIDNKKATLAARIWLSLLKDLKVDLLRYGHAEHTSLGYRSYRDNWLYPGRDVPQSSIKFITYGPKVEDWTIYVIPAYWAGDALVDLYTVIGQFWASIENPELVSIPGAYVETDGMLEGQISTLDACRPLVQAPCL